MARATSRIGSFQIRSIAGKSAILTAGRHEHVVLTMVAGQFASLRKGSLMHYYYDDCTYQQLAEQLGVSAATVNARLTKARQMLRERLGAVEKPDVV